MLSSSCKFYYNDITVASSVNNKYGDVTIESIPKEQRAVTRFLWEK